MLNRATALLNFADADAQFQRRYCSISPAEALNFNAVCTTPNSLKKYPREGRLPLFVCNNFYTQYIHKGLGNLYSHLPTLEHKKQPSAVNRGRSETNPLCMVLLFFKFLGVIL